MKKIKFAAQVFILVASFPLLFVSGISHHSKKTSRPEMQIQDSPTIQKKTAKDQCLCQVEAFDYKDIFHQSLIKY